MNGRSSREGRRLVVRGRVQGVGFRAFACREARRLGLVGWVRNRADGTVELEVEGTPSQLEALHRQLRQGPRFARVDALDEEPLAESQSYESFDINFR